MSPSSTIPVTVAPSPLQQMHGDPQEIVPEVLAGSGFFLLLLGQV